jgi:hypothetical protein
MLRELLRLDSASMYGVLLELGHHTPGILSCGR